MTDQPALKDILKAQWEDMAEDWVRLVQDCRKSHRTAFLDKWMLNALGDVSGQNVIDLGCGEGRFSRMLTTRGASVTGVDLCQPLIEYAKQHRASNEVYLVGDMENLVAVPTEKFDLAVSYVTLVDVPNMPSAVQEAFRVLHPGGRFIVCNLHPMISASPGWVKQGNRKLHYPVDCYFEESERKLSLREGQPITNFHRTLSTHVSTFLNAGFAIEDIREPTPTSDQARRYPYVSDNLRVPEFIIYILRKPSHAL